MYYPDLKEIKKYKKEGNLIPVYREIVADMETPVSAFLKVNQGKNSFLLESIEGGQKLARYSFIGTEPYRIISTNTNDNIDPLPLIAEELSKYKMISVGDLPPFCGGAIGYLSYETTAHFEELPSPGRDSLHLPESLFMFVKTLLVFDHVTHKIKIISFMSLDGSIEDNYEEAVAKIDELAERLSQPLRIDHTYNDSIPPLDDLHFSSNFSKTDFMNAVIRIKDYITSGEAIQAVLSQRLSYTTDVAPFEVYRALRTINPSPYMFFLDLGDFQILGASPEILVRVEGNKVMTRPLAGTRPRGKNPAEDAILEKELRNDEKECAEHIMLVDLGRNDVGRVSQPGTVKVSELMDIERYSHVMHLVTHVQGKLDEKKTMFDALRSCFPAGTVSGAPKIRAMEIIAELEPDKRGPYAGAVGYFSFSGNMDMAIAIRTLVAASGKIYTQAGCGIVYDSVPEQEFEESMNKARAQLTAIAQAESITIARSKNNVAAN